MVNICEMRVEIYPHNDFNYMRCLVTFDNDYINDFDFFGTRFDWVNKLIWLEEAYPDVIFKLKFFEEA